jgi:regulator of cell morphogenesis and NO signaling
MATNFNSYFCFKENSMQMDKTINYTASHKMSDLATNNYRILLVLSRFGIGLGFGEKTIAEVCEENNVDTGTFLVVTNMLLEKKDPEEYNSSAISLEALITYLQKSHKYFLTFRLPGIRNDMVEVLDETQHKLNEAVLRYFDEYVNEVCKHMMYEEKKVFPYVRSLLAGKNDGKYNIDIFQRHHDQIELRLKEFKNILIKYYPARGTNELNNVLFNIFNCEHDLASHNEIEDRIFIPAILDLEQKNLQKDEQTN